MESNQNYKKAIYFVNGMHCAACEVIITKEISKLKSIIKVHASLKDNSVTIISNSNININDINKALKPFNYRLSDKKTENSTKINWLNIFYGLIFTGLLISIFKYFNSLNFINDTNLNKNSSIISFFVFGLIAGLSTCAALVGGFLLSLSKKWQHNNRLKHIEFHIGRLTGFAFFGAILGTIGQQTGLSLFNNNYFVTALLILIISVYMIINGLSLFKINLFNFLTIKLPTGISTKIIDENRFQKGYMPLIAGALTFFLPCGFTIIAQTIALTSGSALSGGLIMLSFAVGTFIPLVLISIISGTVINKNNQIFNYAVGFVLIFFGIYYINSQALIFGLPSINFNKNNSIINSQQTDKYQIIETSADYRGYQPQSINIIAGKPTLWRIINNGVSGCTGSIISRQLLGNQTIKLDQPITEIKLPALKPGIYKYSCWMGMYYGEINVN